MLHARSKVNEFFKLFSNSGSLVNPAKSILNSIYATLQAETLILTCPPFSSFSCQSFRQGGGGGLPLKADSHEGSHIASTDTNTNIFIKHNIFCYYFDFKICTV